MIRKKFNVLTKGLGASPGAATGRVALDAQTAVELSKLGKESCVSYQRNKS